MDNTCVSCGCVIPEGRLQCPSCEMGFDLIIASKVIEGANSINFISKK